MRRILQDLPYFNRRNEFYFGHGYVVIPPLAIPVRVSTSIFTDTHVPAVTSFPAILDTGFDGGLLLTASHLDEWAKCDPKYLGQPSTHHNIRGCRAKLFPQSRFYIRPNESRTWKQRGEKVVEVVSPVLLIESGLDVFPFPLLGLKALSTIDASLHINCATRLVQLNTA